MKQKTHRILFELIILWILIKITENRKDTWINDKLLTPGKICIKEEEEKKRKIQK